MIGHTNADEHAISPAGLGVVRRENSHFGFVFFFKKKEEKKRGKKKVSLGHQTSENPTDFLWVCDGLALLSRK